MISGLDINHLVPVPVLVHVLVQVQHRGRICFKYFISQLSVRMMATFNASSSQGFVRRGSARSVGLDVTLDTSWVGPLRNTNGLSAASNFPPGTAI